MIAAAGTVKLQAGAYRLDLNADVTLRLQNVDNERTHCEKPSHAVVKGVNVQTRALGRLRAGESDQKSSCLPTAYFLLFSLVSARETGGGPYQPSMRLSALTAFFS